MKPLPLDRLNELFRLDFVREDDGYINCHVIRKTDVISGRNRFVRHKAGTRAGYVSPNGYRLIRVDGTNYFEHRIIYGMLHDTSEFPILDHADQNKLHNHPDNLRVTDYSKNRMNTSTSKGYREWFRGGFRAVIKKDGKQYAKIFKTEQDAIAWRSQMQSRLMSEVS